VEKLEGYRWDYEQIVRRNFMTPGQLLSTLLGLRGQASTHHHLTCLDGLPALVAGFERPTEPERDEYRRHSTLCECFSPRGIVIFNERHLRRVLSSYVDYYERTRTHLSLDKDGPDLRPIQPPRIGRVVAIPKVAGLHHRYERLAA
jgi:hypothetical protein